MSILQLAAWVRWASSALLLAVIAGALAWTQQDKISAVMIATVISGGVALLLNPMRRWLRHAHAMRAQGVDTRTPAYRRGIRVARRIQATQRRLFMSVGLAIETRERLEDPKTGEMRERVRYRFPKVLDSVTVTETGVTLTIEPLTRARPVQTVSQVCARSDQMAAFLGLDDVTVQADPAAPSKRALLMVKLVDPIQQVTWVDTGGDMSTWFESDAS